MTKVTGNREHKDRLFISIFRNKEDLLSLYNAVNDSNYEDPEALEITTIEDVLYMGMKNDVSFLIDGYLNLYEIQSTWNPNMPLRGLFYFSRLYAGYVEAHNLNIYSSVQLKLPTPRYIVFYNGTKHDDERMVLRLSSSYEKLEEEPSLECTATVLNINRGYNGELMEKCRKLYEYSYLIEKIRDYLGIGKTLESAIDLAINDCVINGILEEYLRKHRAEVKFMILSEYDEERHMRQTYEEGKEEGKKEGQEQVNALIQRLIEDGRMEDMRRCVTDPQFQQELFQEYNL